MVYRHSIRWALRPKAAKVAISITKQKVRRRLFPSMGGLYTETRNYSAKRSKPGCHFFNYFLLLIERQVTTTVAGR